MLQFIGIIHKDGDSDYGISFPDFVGCVSAGKDVDEVLAMAHEALQGHIDTMREYGDPLPDRPMSFQQVMQHDLAKDAVLFIGVSARLPNKTVRVNVMLDEHLLQEIAEVSSNRSAFLAEAARERLQHMR
jgi:predicted RNase H-like HicB family nuclease